jgi:hypothetical protein
MSEEYAVAKRIPFRMVMHMNCGKTHHLDYLNRELNLACCITTPYRNGQPGKGVKEFGINERTAKSYKTLAALLKAHPAIAQKAAGLYPPNAEVSDGGPLTHKQPAAQSRRSLH